MRPAAPRLPDQREVRLQPAFAEQNIASSFEFAQQLVRAKDVQDVLKLQADFIKRQMQAPAKQARELGESTSQAAKRRRDAGALMRTSTRFMCSEFGGCSMTLRSRC
jgi:Phasin protein